MFKLPSDPVTFPYHEDNGIHEIVKIIVKQAGFVKNGGTTNAIHAAWLLMEKYREKDRPLYIAFLNLDQAFDRVPHAFIWYALRQHSVRRVQLLYHDPKSKVQSMAGVSKPLRVSVGVHQGSALSSLLFVLVMETATRDIQRSAPYTLLYADDVFLASNSKNDLEQFVQKWNDRLMQHGLKLNLNKTEFLTIDPHETGTITVSGSDLPKTERFKYLGPMESYVMKLLHTLSQPGSSGVP